MGSSFAMSTPCPGTIRVAPSPFDRVAADVILRSSDKVDFYVYKAVMLLASSFFETMFSLKQPSPELSDTSITEHPIIDVPEDSKTLEALLCFCYPIDDPDIHTLEQLDQVLTAAIKYEIDVVVKLLRRILQTFVPNNSREVYALACRHNLEDEACMAAETWKGLIATPADATDFASTIPGATFVPEMHGITAGAYYRLLVYLRSGFGILPKSFCSPSPDILYLLSELKRSLAENLKRPLFKRKDADIIIRSCDGVDFPVHHIVLIINDGDELLRRAVHVEDLDSLRVLQVDITVDVLRELLSLCYPAGMMGSKARMPSIRTYSETVRTAVRYDMKAVVRTIQRNWNEDVKEDPLALYLIAARFGWSSNAQEAANCLVDARLDHTYSTELEHTSASIYQALLKFHHLYQVTVMQVFSKYGVRKESYGEPTIDVSRGRWMQAWPSTQLSGKYLRSVPSVIAEVHAERLRRSSRFDMTTIVAATETLETDVKEAVQDLRIELNDTPSTEVAARC